MPVSDFIQFSSYIHEASYIFKRANDVSPNMNNVFDDELSEDDMEKHTNDEDEEITALMLIKRESIGTLLIMPIPLWISQKDISLMKQKRRLWKQWRIT